MGEQKLAHRYTIEEYLNMEAVSEERHEYHKGEVFAMAGGTYNHGLIGANASFALNMAARDKNCSVLSGDVRIRQEAADRFLYPDASVVCGEPEFGKTDKHAVTNPVLLVEVLSESSEAYDRGAKFFYYQQIPSLKEYLIIDQFRPVVTQIRRAEGSIWEIENHFGLDSAFKLVSLDATISLADIYRNVRELKEPFEE